MAAILKKVYIDKLLEIVKNIDQSKMTPEDFKPEAYIDTSVELKPKSINLMLIN